MKVLVTGANGYLGQGIVKQLLDDGVTVVATDLLSSNIDKRAIIKTCNLFDVENPFIFFDKPDVVLHLAWRNGFAHNDQSHLNDLPNHYAFLKKFIDLGIKRIAVMGTMHEVGFYEGEIDENTPCFPLSLYGVSKNALRQLVFSYARDKDVKIQWLRAFYIVGNIRYGSSIFSKLLTAADEGKTLFPFTSGKNKYDFLDYEEFCKQIKCTVIQDEMNGIINICSGKPVSLADRVNKFIEDNRLNIKLDYNKFPDRPYDSKAIWGNNKKISIIMDKYAQKRK